MKQLAALLHTLRCREKHLETMEQLKTDTHFCHYYLEQVIVDEWELPSHLKWLEEAEEFMNEIGAESPSQALSALNRVVLIRREAEEILEKFPALRKLLIELLA